MVDGFAGGWIHDGDGGAKDGPRLATIAAVGAAARSCAKPVPQDTAGHRFPPPVSIDL